MAAPPLHTLAADPEIFLLEDAIRMLNRLAPGSAITDYHLAQFVRTMQERSSLN